MNDKSRQFIRQKFREYYTRANLEPPENVWEREFGIVPINELYPEKMQMHRHIGFNKKEELKQHLLNNVPAHVYHSTASYKYPREDNMNRKEWLGADLIFDIDADHIVPEQNLPLYSHEELLELSKQEMLKLLTILTNTFGFEENNIKIVFSGARGYHAHVTAKTVQKLHNKERREICDYITAKGLDANAFIKRGSERELRWKRMITTGWGRTLHTELAAFLTEIASMEDEKKALKIIQDISTATKLTAQKIQRFAKDEYVMSRVRNAEMPTPLDKKLNENLLRIATILATTKHACIIDEQVTVDTKRLIRTPYSLHGKTGLIAMPITIEELEGFAPLTDAITFRNEETKIIATKECFGTLKGERIKLRKDGISTVREYHAVYFMCRNQAELI